MGSNRGRLGQYVGGIVVTGVA